MHVVLTDSERQHLRQLQKQRRDDEGYVKVTVMLLLDKDRPASSIAEDLGLDEATVYRYAQARHSARADPAVAAGLPPRTQPHRAALTPLQTLLGVPQRLAQRPTLWQRVEHVLQRVGSDYTITFA